MLQRGHFLFRMSLMEVIIISFLLTRLFLRLSVTCLMWDGSFSGQVRRWSSKLSHISINFDNFLCSISSFVFQNFENWQFLEHILHGAIQQQLVQCISVGRVVLKNSLCNLFELKVRSGKKSEVAKNPLIHLSKQLIFSSSSSSITDDKMEAFMD